MTLTQPVCRNGTARDYWPLVQVCRIGVTHCQGRGCGPNLGLKMSEEPAPNGDFHAQPVEGDFAPRQGEESI